MQYQFSKEKGFTIVSLPSSSVHDARVLDRPPTPTPAEFILGGITTVILIWAILVGSQWAYEVLSELVCVSGTVVMLRLTSVLCI